jgi:hypothetical protein
VIKGGALGGMTRFIALRLDTIKSNSNSVTKFIIDDAYFPESKKEDSQYELKCDKVVEFTATKNINDFVIIGADTNASIGTIKLRSKIVVKIKEKRNIKSGIKMKGRGRKGVRIQTNMKRKSKQGRL